MASASKRYTSSTLRSLRSSAAFLSSLFSSFTPPLALSAITRAATQQAEKAGQ